MSSRTDDRANGGHVAERALLARLDGELSAAEAARIDAHCDECGRCAAQRDELTAIRAALREGRDVTPLRPVWPQIRDKVRARSRTDLSFAFGAGLAVTAGLLLGVVLGTSVVPSDVTAGAATTVTSTTDPELSSWITLGSSLPDVYGLSSEGGGT